LGRFIEHTIYSSDAYFLFFHHGTFTSSLFGGSQVVQFFIGMNGSYLTEANTMAFFNLIHNTLPRSSAKTWDLGTCFQSREIDTVDDFFL
jgi:hypothetical protein